MGSREEACSGEGTERLLRDFPGPPWNRSSKETLLFNVSETHIPNQVQIHIPNPRFWNAKGYEMGKVSLSLEQIQLVEKSDQNWCESIYNLHLSHPVWFFLYVSLQKHENVPLQVVWDAAGDAKWYTIYVSYHLSEIRKLLQFLNPSGSARFR